MLIRSEIEKHLKYDCILMVEQSVTSTNAVLKQQAAFAPERTVLVAASQSEGRGRMGRSFYSPDKSGIYMSLLLKKGLKAEDSLILTAKAAVAVANAIEKISDKKAYIKWVNDIYVDGKKVCGILTEGALKSNSDQLEYAVVGIGINLMPFESTPDEIKDIAGSVLDAQQEGVINKMAAQIINEFFSALKNDTYEEYKRRSWLDGERVDVIQGDRVYSAEVVGVDDQYRLKVINQNGELITLSSGEVSIRKK